MIIVLPKWYLKAREELDKVVDNITRKNNIDGTFAEDSRAIENGKNMILNSLVGIYEKVDVEGRERMEKFEKKWRK